ncbi:MAG: 23S rRNA (adenine(2503)-C(2))-methyltransferase RlmN [Deltaproteobacteria bacterium]|nr:23S rRNA (adenine(2503)-C(2))-methyltransferase RlmN [Deltaproteobacteria bacterium]MBM4324298.1 23S rRNA (adenine(2503)-C(2))-methyltransferase RlmN [Deltaproteobacteria bacterium]
MNCLGKIDLKNLSPSELESFITSFGKERYRSIQLMRWLYKIGVHRFDEMTNLSKTFRQELSHVSFVSFLSPLQIEKSNDGTQKFLFGLEDGNRVESVLIPEKKRLTLCLSTQAGCAMGCRFCLTGKKGLKRNLTTGEIVNQILAVRETLPDQTSITNIVLMGMGEPLANYGNTLKAIELMTHPESFKFSSRRVTLSTVGLLSELKQLAQEKIRFRLAVSLNASTEETRSRLMPINLRHPLKKLLELCRKYPLPPRARITFEYVLLEGENDSPEDAKRLLKLLKGIPSKINLIPLNEAPGIPYKKPSEERVRQFQEILMEGGLTAIIRASKGADISAACGQLQAKKSDGQNK